MVKKQLSKLLKVIKNQFLYILFRLIDCWLLNVPWQIFHAYSGREPSSTIINIENGVELKTTGQLPLEKESDGSSLL